jgi:hypothetical protein
MALGLSDLYGTHGAVHSQTQEAGKCAKTLLFLRTKNRINSD